jgi:hypothetical protein
MKMRIAAVLVALTSTSLIAQQPDSVAKVGDIVTITVTGDLARDVAKRISALPEDRPLDGLEVQLAAVVRDVSLDGTLYIEYWQMMRDEKPIRLMTLAGKVNPQKLTTDITPKGSKIYSSPEAEPTFTTEDCLNRRLKLADLKGFKLLTWTLAEELGE